MWNETPKLNPTQWGAIFHARQDLRKVKGDEKKILEITSRIYAVLALAPPKVYRFPSPLSAMLAIPHLAALHNVEGYESQLQKRLLDPLTSQLGGNPGDVTWAQGARGRAVADQVTQALLLPVREQLNGDVVCDFTDRLGAFLREEKGDAFAAERLEGGLFKDIHPKTLDWWRLVSPSASWWWPYTKFVVISDRPIHTGMDEEQRLHGETGAAMKFSDGSGVYSWHGITVPESIILEPATITVGVVRAQVNAEVQRVMIERMGAGRYLNEVGATLVDMDSLTLEGSAPRALMEDDLGNLWLVGTDGSTARVYTMAVPRAARSCREAHDLIAGFSEARLIAEA